MKDFRNNVFTETAIHTMLDRYHTMIAPFAVGAGGEQAGATYLAGGAAGFTTALSDLKTHVTSRRALVATYVP
jgi:hypothetical protein